MDVNPVYDPNRKHVVSFDTANSLDAVELEKILKPENALPLSEIKFKDLAIYPGIGIYIIYDLSDKPCYIGKCTSRSFIERVPSHFDCRKHAYLATILRRLGSLDHNGDDISEITLRAIDSFKILLVNFTYDGRLRENGNISEEDVKPKTKDEAKEVGKLERELINYLKPKLNSY